MKPSVKLVCAAAIAIGGSLAAMEASTAMPIASPAQTAVPSLVQEAHGGAFLHRWRHRVHHHYGFHHGRRGLHRGHR